MESVFWGSQIRATLESLLERAKTEVWLISPYTKTEIAEGRSDLLSKCIIGALHNNVRVRMVIRSQTDKGGKVADGIRPLLEAGLELYELDDLHAKLYLSETRAIVTSLNLYAPTSETTLDLAASFESGSTEYNSLMNFIRQKIAPTARPIELTERSAVRVVKTRKEVVVPATPAAPRAPARRGRKTPPKKKESGFFTKAAALVSNDASCIRCGEGIEFAPEKPLCVECYPKWVRYKNEDFREKHCHDCGEPAATSMRKPVCKDCFAAA